MRPHSTNNSCIYDGALKPLEPRTIQECLSCTLQECDGCPEVQDRKEHKMQEIGIQISKRKREIKITNKDIGTSLGYHQSHIDNWTCGRKIPKLEDILPLCKVLRCDPNYLFDIESDSDYLRVVRCAACENQIVTDGVKVCRLHGIAFGQDDQYCCHGRKRSEKN